MGIFNLNLSPEERARIEHAARVHGVKPSRFIREELAHVTAPGSTGIGWRVQFRIWYVEKALLPDLESNRARVHRHIERYERLLERVPGDIGAVVEADLDALRDELNELDERITIHRQEVTNIRNHHAPPRALAIVPFTLLMIEPTTMLLGVAAAILGGALLIALTGKPAWAAKRLAGVATRVPHTQRSSAPASDEESVSANAVDPETALHRFYENDRFLEDHLRGFAGAEDGLEKIRVFCEDATLRAKNREGEDVKLFLLAVTEAQRNAIPPEVAQELASRRSRRMFTRTVTVESTPRSNGATGVKAVPE